jgi:hypothetical protein
MGIALCLLPALVLAQGFAGKRFFPTTLSVGNPFVADDLGLQLQRAPKTQDHPLTGHSRRTGLSAAALYFSKRITHRLQVSVRDAYRYTNPRSGPAEYGMGNVGLGVRLQGPVRRKAEAAVAIGFNVEIGGSGSDSVNNNSYTTFSPVFYFAQGFGRLPNEVKYLRPLALTGDIAYHYPTRGRAPWTLDTAFTLQYSLMYLQSMLKSHPLPPVVRNLIPVVEFPLRIGLNRGYGADLAGTVNPGFIWATEYGQLGLEAAIPINHRTGRDVGAVLQLSAYLGQIFPHSVGKPIFGRVFNKPVDLED